MELDERSRRKLEEWRRRHQKPARPAAPPPKDKFEQIVRAIVEGQLRGFINDHPSILEGVDWYRQRADRRVTLINSIAKRIVRDLVCPDTRARLVAALLECSAGTPLEDATGTGCWCVTAGIGKSYWFRRMRLWWGRVAQR